MLPTWIEGELSESDTILLSSFFPHLKTKQNTWTACAQGGGGLNFPSVMLSEGRFVTPEMLCFEVFSVMWHDHSKQLSFVLAWWASSAHQWGFQSTPQLLLLIINCIICVQAKRRCDNQILRRQNRGSSCLNRQATAIIWEIVLTLYVCRDIYLSLERSVSPEI